jgi:FAD/FMN-containing dehydrogenase
MATSIGVPRLSRGARALLAFARKNGLRVAVRGGGHSFPGHSVVDDGIIIDLRHMNQVSVDPSDRCVTVGGGAVWSEVMGRRCHMASRSPEAMSHTPVSAA